MFISLPVPKKTGSDNSLSIQKNVNLVKPTGNNNEAGK
jgi:hypothetical protein